MVLLVGDLRSRNKNSMLTAGEQGQVCLVGVVQILDRNLEPGTGSPTQPSYPAPSKSLGTLLLYCFLQVVFHSSHWVSSISSGYRAKLTMGSSSRTLSSHILRNGIIRDNACICQGSLAWLRRKYLEPSSQRGGSQPLAVTDSFEKLVKICKPLYNPSHQKKCMHTQ